MTKNYQKNNNIAHSILLSVSFSTASASFSTPIGYQTNLMVSGAGGYHFKDYFYFGAPLTVFVGIVTLVIVPWVWPM